MKSIDYKNVKIKEGFIGRLQQLNADVSVYNVYKRFEETGRFRALLHIRDDAHKAHVFWDSDVAKWLESAAYILAVRKDEKLLGIVKKTVDDICAHQMPCGYFNSYYQVYEPENIFKHRSEHELYCAGHLIEAAVALKESGADEKLYAAMKKYADYIYERFYVKKDAGFVTCGHPEIELALVKLYETSREEKYLALARYFVDERGKREEMRCEWADSRYDQSHKPVREQKEAVGHAVRALYLYCAMADLARIDEDKELSETCEALFADIVNKKMYITGGTGSSYHGEAFTFPYDLPNFYAYDETCAAIALALFCARLAKRKNAAVYHDVFERALYNNILAGESKDGKAFFYVNPLEMCEEAVIYNDSLKQKQHCPIPERVEVFDCSCCPPNFVRFIESIGGCIYGEEDGKIYVNQYISSETEIEGTKIQVRSEMPYGGRAEICVQGAAELCLRVPSWNAGITMKVNGRKTEPAVKEGYICLYCDGDIEISLDFHIKPRFVYANENVRQDGGRKAVQYGAMVLCGESCDNGKQLSAVRIKSLAGAKAAVGEYFTLDVKAERLKTSAALYSYDAPVAEPITLRLVPYFAWANRGRGDMRVWWL